MIQIVRELALAASIAAAGGTLAGFFGARWWFLDLFSHFRTQYAVALLLASVIFFALGEPGWALGAGAFAVGNAAVIARHFSRHRPASAEGDGAAGGRLRFVLSNVRIGNRDYDGVLRFLKEADGDVVLLEEVDTGWLEALSELDGRYPWRVKVAESIPYGIALWSRIPVRSYEVLGVVREDIPFIAASLDVSGTPLLLLGAHPPPPWNGVYASVRDRQIEALGRMAAKGGPHVVLLGDLNTTPWGCVFREMVRDSGLRDSSRGGGFSWSWPVMFPPLAILIDHALVSTGVRVLDRRLGPAVGSDHYPLLLDVSLD